MEQSDDEAVPLDDIEVRFAQAFRKACEPDDPQEQMMRGVIARYEDQLKIEALKPMENPAESRNKMHEAFKQVQSRISRRPDSADSGPL